jgi:hypothetical protein
LACPQIVSGPDKSRISNTWSVHGDGGIEHRLDDSALCRRISDGTERETEWVGDEQRSRWLDDRRDLDHLRDRQR